MQIGILQPGYLPWLGFFEQLSRSDLFILYDDVQYDRNSWRNRNRIKTAQGIQWLTVPVCYQFSEKPRIQEIRIDNRQKWAKKHLSSLYHAYHRAPFFKTYFPRLETIYAQNWEYLVDLDIALIEQLSHWLGLTNQQIIRSSTLSLTQTERQMRLIEICQLFQADSFYEGAAGQNYIDQPLFARHHIEVVFQNYTHPVYQQLHGEFIPYLSSLDLLLNQGPQSADILHNRHT
jgi:hypothetical protein